MTNDQIQALEALCTAAHGRYNTLVDLGRVPLSIKANTLDELLTQGFIRTAGRQDFTVTSLGIHQASENRYVPPTDD